MASRECKVKGFGTVGCSGTTICCSKLETDNLRVVLLQGAGGVYGFAGTIVTNNRLCVCVHQSRRNLYMLWGQKRGRPVTVGGLLMVETLNIFDHERVGVQLHAAAPKCQW